MGRAKELQWKMEEEHRKGYKVPSSHNYLCSSHLKNQYLKQYIDNKGQNGICSYCGKKSIVLEFANFIDYIGSRLTSYIGPIDNENLFLANSFYDDEEEIIPGYIKRGPYIAPTNAEFYEDAGEVMSDFDLESNNKELNRDIEKSLLVENWIRKDPTGMILKDEMLMSWKNFSNLVKTKSRYTFFRHDEYYTDAYGNKYMDHDILEETSILVKNLEESIPCGTVIYRGRPVFDKPFSTFAELTAPPAKYAKNNRMSPYGISLFYGSFDKDTPKKEILNYLTDKNTSICIGKFETIRELKVINLCNIPNPDFWMEEKDDWQKYSFLHLFHSEISKPIGTADEELEYIPSQVFSEYLRLIQMSNDNTPYDGLIYQSSLTKEKNLVLFYNNKTSIDILSLNNTFMV